MTLRIRFLIVALIALAMACGGPPPTTTKLNRLYQGLADPLPRIDPSILGGRSVVIDPGHGGHFRGTVGQDSLEESTVNLAVGLYLWGLLREAGAEVWLTRSIDRDFLAPEDSALATDLQARIAMSDSLEPDVFVSIHHNAQPQRDPDYNNVETYYKSGDPASLDLAFAVHRHLMRNLGIDAGEVRPGNYYVLRNNSTAAILGESSYLTHPPVEERLRLSDALRLEAEAYFLGIIDYFSRGIPRIAGIEAYHPREAVDLHVPGVSAVREMRTPVLAYSVHDDGGPGIDPDGIVLQVNGQTVSPSFAPNTHRVEYVFPADAANREYDVALTVRNLLGNTSPVFHDTVSVNLPARTALFDNVSAAPGGVARVRARIMDVRGIPVREGKPVDVSMSTRDQPVRAAVADGFLDLPFIVPDGVNKVAVSLSVDGQSFDSAIDIVTDGSDASPPAFGDYIAVNVTDARAGTPVPGAVATLDGRVVSEKSSVAGAILVPRNDYTTTLHLRTVSAPGYAPYYFSDPRGLTDSVTLVPWFDGVLHGKKFMIDPEGGRARDIGMGKLGLSASEVNLRVAGYLAGFLRNAGADARMTRTTEAVTPPEDIARNTNRWGADRYIEIRHRAEPEDSALAVKTYHFPGSRTGPRFAADVGRALARRLGVPARPATDLVTYPLQQTACPAIVLEAPSIGNVDEEMRLDDPWYLREQAYAIFLGIVDHFFAPEGSRVEVQVAGGGHWLVELGGTWHLLTESAGRAAFEFVPPGQYWIIARRGDEERWSDLIDVAGEDTLSVRIAPAHQGRYPPP